MITTEELDCQDLHVLSLSADKLLHSGSLTDICALLVHVKENLATAYLSDLSSVRLERFIELQFRELVLLLDSLANKNDGTWPDPSYQDTVLWRVFELLDYTLTLKSDCAQNDYIPLCYFSYRIARLQVHSSSIRENLHLSGVEITVVRSLINYLDKFEKCRVATFYALSFYEKFLKAIATLDFAQKDISSDIHQKLLEINFNDLNYISRYQELLLDQKASTGKDKGPFFSNIQNAHFPYQYASDPGCYPQLPHLGFIIYKWAQEFNHVSCDLNAEIQKITHAKLTLHLPVSQIALITKLCYEQQIFGDLSLTYLFKFICANFSSKRQENISRGSLSKEFYSTEQITAGRVMNLLQQLAKKIKHDFFPG